jgi:iron complex transport system substrate-binding protein
MLDAARLSALAPDVVVTQEACEVCAVSYEQVVSSLQRTAHRAAVVSLRPTRLGDVLDDVRKVASACGVPERGERVVGDLRARLSEVAQRSGAGPRPRVAVVEWLAPLMLAGHWVPDAIEASGGVPVGPAAGVPSPYATWDDLRALAPDAIVVAPCGFDLARTETEAEPWLQTLRGLSPRVLLADGNAYFNRPGPRIVDAVETLAAWLRGEPVPPERGRAVEARALSAR